MTVRVLVVEDSPTVNAALCEALDADPGFEVVGRAFDGEQAVALCARQRPDVISLDMAMPKRDGLFVTRRVMASDPVPILIVSSSMNRDEQMSTYDALAAGAVDILAKPDAGGFDEWARVYRRRLALVSRIPVIRHLRGCRDLVGPAEDREAPALRLEGGASALIALGGSTGSPQALGVILKGAGAALSVPVLLVLHTSAGFDEGLAKWLGAITPLRVTVARDGEPLGLEPRVVVASATRHLVLDEGTLRLDDGPERNHCKPSVDVLFESLVPGASAVTAVLLSGMGRDGAEGMARLRRAGATTVVQDEATCAVWGMPGAAVGLDAAAHVMSPGAIADCLRRVRPVPLPR